jgi:hypothetical protein
VIKYFVPNNQNEPEREGEYMLHNMPTGEYNNGQRSSPCVPKTGPHLQLITKTVLGCQKYNGINPTSAIRQQ